MERTPPGAAGLTPRQTEVLALVERGHTNSEIADLLGITLAGAKWHVSELLSRLGAESREELIERATQSRRAGRHLRGLQIALGSTGGLSGAKLATALLGVVAVASVGAASLAVIRGMDTSGAPASPVAASPPAPRATATPPTLPDVPTATLRPREALARGLELAQQELHNGRLDPRTIDIPNASDLVLQSATWYSAITHYDSPDGDHYWDAPGSQPFNAWAFIWNLDEPAAPGRPAGRHMDVELLFRDEVNGAMLAVDLNANGSDGGGGGFLNRADDLRFSEVVTHATPSFRVAWLDGKPGGPALAVYRNRAGDICVETQAPNGEPEGGSCPFTPPGSGDSWLRVIRGATYDEAGHVTAARVIVGAPASTDRIELRFSNARSAVIPVESPPGEAGAPLRFAYFAVEPNAGFPTVVALDAGGAELGRAVVDRPPEWAPSPSPAPEGR